ARALRDAPVAVLGAGSWGTALAIRFAGDGRPGRLWGRDRGRLADMAVSRRNERYLASAQFPDSLQVEPELATALAAARDVLIVVPSHAFRSLLAELAPHLAPELHIAWATKGFEHGSLKLPHQIAREVLGAERGIAVLSGPTFAREVGAGLPTAMTVASPDAPYARALAHIGQAVEGYAAAVAIHEVASRAGVEMPLCEMAYRVLYQRLPAREAVRSLMSRPIKAEAE